MKKTKSVNKPPKPKDPFDGVLLVDKPANLTSHDVVARIRHTFKLRKVGHGGTLDPMATGLLIILVGRGTKLSQRVMDTDKTYEGVMELGISTDSHDKDGQVIATRNASHVTREDLERILSEWTGDLQQTPPMVSAIKKDGVPLYKLARRGKTVERESRLIHVYEFSLLDFKSPEAAFRLRCTKGTYVRTLCSDLGDALGCGAHLNALRRTAIGPFNIEDAHTLESILELDRDELEERVFSPYKLLSPDT